LKNSSVNSAGLRGQVAGETELCTVGQSGTGLTYRGYEITDLAENAEFEEIAFLLLKGHLPNLQELNNYKSKLKKLRNLPEEVKKVQNRLSGALKKWMKSQGDLGQETELAALERQRRGKKKGANKKSNKS